MANKRSKSQIFKYSLKRAFPAILVFFFVSCNYQTAAAQTYSSTNKKAIKLYTEAQSFYQGYKLSEAKESLNDALEKDPSFVEAQTLLAYINLDEKDYENAKLNFEKAIEINPTAIPNNFYFLGELELNNGEYEAANKLLTTFVNMRGVDPRMVDKANKGLDNIDFALKAKTTPYPFEPFNLGPAINSRLDEYFPSMTVDEKTLLFTRRLEAPNTPTGFNEDFYISTKLNGDWQKAKNLSTPINTEYNEGAPTLAANGQLLIYTACELYGDYGGGKQGLGSCDLFYSTKSNKTWTKPINLGRNINSNHWETQPSFSSDGKSLYFVRGIRDRSGARRGDIYFTTLNPNGSWSKPTPLNNNINTTGDEESVFIHPDGKTLYFASNGHVGMGGTDLYMSKKDSTGEWGPAINLGYPINTHKNENSLLVSANGNLAFFASNREGGLGGLDLYAFELPTTFSPTEVTYFSGKIYDKTTKKPLGARFELIDLENNEVVVEAFSDNISGEFLISLPTGRNYALNASKSGYLFYSENFSLKGFKNGTPFNQNVPLQPIATGEKIVLKNIFFETGKYNLKKESKIELNKLVAFLETNPNLKIEVSGHTDNVGNATSNLKLSEQRALAVKDFLIENGIPASNLQSRGYGATQPIVENNSEENRAKNRRTEFKIVEL